MDYEHFHKRIDVSRETFTRLETYVAHLLKWQQRINLISPKTIPDIWERHIIDSAQLASLIPNKETRIADLGSGAGLPGLILAIMGHQDVHLIESDERKSIFLSEAARVTDTKLTIHLARIESNPLNKFDIITARACASLEQLLTWSYPMMSQHAICYFAKGKNYAMEIDDARKGWSFEFTCHPSITDPDSVIIELQQLAPRPV